MASDPNHLNRLIAERDAMELVLDGEYVELHWRGKVHKKQKSTERLEYLNRRIRELEIAAARSHGPPRNTARVVR